MIGRWNRALGPRRLRRALRSATRPPPSSILILCLGNICRSPYAERRLRRELTEAGLPSVDVGSAGFIRPGRPSPELARRVAAGRGVDLEDHQSRVLDAEVPRAVDLVLVMSRDQGRRFRRLAGSAAPRTIVLGDFDPEPSARRGIPDPFDCPEEVFDAVYERIDRCCRCLAGALAAAVPFVPTVEEGR